jgi:hypothetical protein
MGAAKRAASRCPTFIRDKFDESFDFKLTNPGPDSLNDEFGKNNVVPNELATKSEAPIAMERWT